MQTYYSDDTRSELLEIHAERILWEWDNTLIDIEDIQVYFSHLIDLFSIELGCDIIPTGRSGRHICIEKSEYRRYSKAVRLWKNKYRKLAIDFIS